MTERIEFDLTRMTPGARALWLDVYELGYAEGIAAGRAQLEAEHTASWHAAAGVARAVAAQPPFDVLAERRGQPERAERHRETLRQRGVAS